MQRALKIWLPTFVAYSACGQACTWAGLKKKKLDRRGEDRRNEEKEREEEVIIISINNNTYKRIIKKNTHTQSNV